LSSIPASAIFDRVKLGIRRLAVLAAAGGLAWIAVWNSTSQPRAAYDTLWYARFGFLYANEPVSKANDLSWEVFAKYADPEIVAYVEQRGGWPWKGFGDQTRQRWVGIYQMRPIVPLIAAAAYPAAGTESLLLVSALAVVIVVLAAASLLTPAAGAIATIAFLVPLLLNPMAGGWLVHLTTDGLGMALWFAVLAFAVPYVNRSSRPCLIAVGASVCILGFTRQSAILVPITFGLCAGAALVAHAPVFRRFVALTAISIPPLLLVAFVTAAAGLPSPG